MKTVKLDQIPSEVVANFFRFLPTLDIGRMMVICKGFNQILTTNPSLWRFIDLDKANSSKNAVNIIQIFASRSRDTLVAVRSPQQFNDGERSQILQVLERSKATLRRLDLDVVGSVCGNFDGSEPSINFFNSFPRIERLNLTTEELPEAEFQTPGRLTFFADHEFVDYHQWSREDRKKVSSVTRLHLSTSYRILKMETLHKVLRACRHNLTHLTLGDLEPGEEEFLEFGLPVLSSLRLGKHGFYDHMFDGRFKLPNLEHLSGSLLGIMTWDSNDLQTLEVEIEDWGSEDDNLDRSERLIKLMKRSDSTLEVFKLKFADGSSFDINPVLQTLKVDPFLSLPSYPHLSGLYIGFDPDHFHALLAEVMVSRNIAAKGWKLKGEDEVAEERMCSDLTLYLDASDIPYFRIAEERVLSRCPESVRDYAGKAKIKEWDGK